MRQLHKEIRGLAAFLAVLAKLGIR